jgi:hypothetical protein
VGLSFFQATAAGYVGIVFKELSSDLFTGPADLDDDVSTTS